jgi:glutamate dehydrogenase
VLYDPQGIDREELRRLADARLMVREFDRARLSAGGFLVDVNDREVTLPDGTVVDNGLNFRNEFHLNPLSSATLFVPCGGRPEAVNISNVDKFFHHRRSTATTAGGALERVPRFKYIVEGANLFFTQEARLVLEEAGVVIFKDASANKGGVTSSSLEVLAALALKDDEFLAHMTVQKSADTGDEVVPDFYRRYIENVHQIIERNAALEFQAVWDGTQHLLAMYIYILSSMWPDLYLFVRYAANKRTGLPRSVIADLVSTKINGLNVQIQNSNLWTNQAFK